MKLKTRLAALALTLLPLAALAEGTVVLAEGRAFVTRDGKDLEAAPAVSLRKGETLTVGSLGKVQVQFLDDSIFVIPGPSKLRVDEFRMPNAGAGGAAVYTLVEGGFRTVTGRISQGRKDRYEMRAEEATVTLSGSSYSSLRCARQCGSHKPGLYVRGEQGIIVVTNAGGRIRLSGGKIAYVPSSTRPPVEVLVSPFSDPQFAAVFGAELKIEGETHPPRIEPERPASPS